MNYILFDDTFRNNLLPFTYTRPVADIRVGILTIREKWEKRLDVKTSTYTQDYLSSKYPSEFTVQADNVWINGSVVPDKELIEQVQNLQTNEVLQNGDTIVAIHTGTNKVLDISDLKVFKSEQTKTSPLIIRNPWDIFSMNGPVLVSDFELLTSGKKSLPISSSNQVINAAQVFLEEGAIVECSILNASTGPIYIGKDAEVMEGSIIRGPFALCEHAALKLGTKIYGPTTIGPHSKVGGEVNNSVVFGYSNKAHDGFLGNSVLGEWCNLGADSNNSNLKNNYSEVKIWSYEQEKYIGTGLTFCGLLMGDHSKCGINTMFNTGTVVGVGANIFGAGFPQKHIPSFGWGGADGFTTYRLDEAFEVAQRVYSRRNLLFDQAEKDILASVFELTKKYRN